VTDNTIRLAQLAALYKFRDFQKEWLTSHNDIELEPELEEMILEFIDDTTMSFIREEVEE
jgi:hypothetical protein